MLASALLVIPACVTRPYGNVEWSHPGRSFQLEFVESPTDESGHRLSWLINSVDTDGENWWFVVTRTRHFDQSSPSLTSVMDRMNLHLYSDEFEGSAIETEDGELRVLLVVDTRVIAGPNIMPWPSYERHGSIVFCAPLRDPAGVSEVFEYAQRRRSPLSLHLNEEVAGMLGDLYRYRPEME